MLEKVGGAHQDKVFFEVKTMKKKAIFRTAILVISIIMISLQTGGTEKTNYAKDLLDE